MLRIDFEQHDVFRRVVAEDGAAESAREGSASRREVQIVGVAIGALQKRLIRVQRREGLNLHQLRFERSAVNPKSTWMNSGRASSFGTRYSAGMVSSMRARYSGVINCWISSRAVARHAVEQRARQKQGVSQLRNLTCVPQPSSSRRRKRWYFSGVKLALKRWRSSRITSDQKLAGAHDLPVVRPDVEFRADHVDVRGAIPLRAGVRAVGIAEGDVDAGDFFILQDIADHAVQADVGADGEFAHAVAVFVGVGVVPELVFAVRDWRSRAPSDDCLRCEW